jgi:spermidine synthase
MNKLLNINIFTNERDLFGDPIIYRTNDAFGDLLVIDHRHYRTLTFDSHYEQSSMDLRRSYILVHEYTRAMMLVLAFIKPQHTTILGLGGGCLVRSLHHVLPECELHVVELRQRVYEVATDFFGMPMSNKIKVTISDAKQQLKYTDDASTNIIFADMYHAYGMNPFQIQQRFINQCHRVLNNQGWLVVNYHEMPDSNTPFFKCLRNLFAEVLVCPISSGNNILFASKQRINASHHFDSTIPELENKLESSLTHLFKRLVKLKDNDE